MLPYAELLQHARQEEPSQNQAEEQAEQKEEGQTQGVGLGQGLGMSFEQLRNLPYTAGLGAEGWQPSGTLSQSLGQLHHPQPHATYGHLLQDRGFPSAFAPAHRLAPQEAIQHSPKHQKPDEEE